ncbi:hypothetical protein [Streptomyces sp. NPDC047725]|uniref:hypothetical protein n=1 Tax=Streptomyces sp. NPDC047725 TaxID=3365487 RepID=UPI003719F1BD
MDLRQQHNLAVHRPSRVPADLNAIAADLSAAEEAGLPRIAFNSAFEAADASRPDEDP